MVSGSLKLLTCYQFNWLFE